MSSVAHQRARFTPVCRGPCVTASLDSVHFLRPCRLGTVAIIAAMVNRTFASSMEVSACSSYPTRYQVLSGWYHGQLHLCLLHVGRAQLRAWHTTEHRLSMWLSPPCTQVQVAQGCQVLTTATLLRLSMWVRGRHADSSPISKRNCTRACTTAGATDICPACTPPQGPIAVIRWSLYGTCIARLHSAHRPGAA